jgi:hypothetical protein
MFWLFEPLEDLNARMAVRKRETSAIRFREFPPAIVLYIS